MNTLTVLGENGVNNMGPSCYLAQTKINGKKINFMVDCGFAINTKANFKYAETLRHICLKGLDLNLPDNLKETIQNTLKKIAENENEIKKELIAPEFSLMNNEKIDFLFLSHGHLDHCGATPILQTEKLFNDKGLIYGSPFTIKFMRLQAKDFIKFNRQYKMNFFDLLDIGVRCKEIPVGETEIMPGLKVISAPSGHIHGTASFIFKNLGKDGKNIGFMTDTCFHDQITLRGAKYLSQILPKDSLPDIIFSADLTYGDEKNKTDKNYYNNEFKKLKKEIRKVIQKGGSVLIPSFMIDRGENMAIGLLNDKDLGAPVYIDGGVRNCIEILKENSWDAAGEIPFTTEGLTYVPDFNKKTGVDARKQILDSNEPKIVIAPSGMGDKGVVGAKWLIEFLKNENNLVAFIGFQMPGSAGYNLLEAEEKALINNSEKYFSFRGVKTHFAAKVKKFDLSAHSPINYFCGYFEDIVSARGKKMEYCLLTHGEQKNKELAIELFSPYFDKIEFGYTGKVIEF